MTFDSLLVFATLMVAVYAVLPEYRRLELKLRWGILDWGLLLAEIILIHYLLFFQFFRKMGFSPGLNLYKWGISPKNTAYLSLIIFGFIIAIHLSTIKLNKRKIYKFRNFTGELIRELRFSDLVKVLEKRLTVLKKIYEADFFLSRLKRKFAPSSLWEVVTLLENEENLEASAKAKSFRKIYRKPLSIICKILPSYSKPQNASQDVVRSFLLSNDFTEYVAKNRPYFAIEIYKNDFREAEEFYEGYFKTILSNTSSIFYQEIKNNQNLSTGHSYALLEENRLLSFFFLKASVAEKFSVWKPVGEFMIAYLDDLHRDKDRDPYNYSMEDFHERGQWECPLFVGIRFFDIMVSSALHQNIKWHMWLYYFPHFTKRIVRNYCPHEGYVNLDSEFPTKYNYLLYEIISALRYWIVDVDVLPEDQENIHLSKVSTTHENGNIPKSAILAIGQCLHHILSSTEITAEFKNYMACRAFSLYFDLHKVDRTRPYSDVLKLSLKQGGFYRYDNNTYYSKCLMTAFQGYDKIPHKFEAVKDFEEFLAE